jgi:hypothetical protein
MNISLLSLLVATTDGGIVFVLDVTTHEIYGRYADHYANPVRAIAHLSDSLVATGDRLGEVRIWDVNTRDTISVNQFRERVIELGYDARSQRLYVITEAEVASLQLDSGWFLASDRQDVLVERKETIDISGAQTQQGTVDLPQNRGFDEMTERPFPFVETISALDDVEITKSFELKPAEDRLLRRFTSWRRGTRCVLGLLSGGLSDARVFRVKVFDHSGATRINAVAKIGSRAAIQAEAYQYDTEVSRLSPNATPRRLEGPDFSDESAAGVFYSLTEGYDRSAFQVAVEALATVPSVIDHVASLTAPWRDGVRESRMTIGDVRQRILDDSKLKELAATYSLNWVTEFEQRTVQVRWCTIHGDLHGGNILVDQHGIPMIIDYGDIGEGSAPFDPITLEFSYFVTT